MKAASGNVTDKTSFKLVVSEHLKSFKAALESRYFVGDAALYTSETVKELDQQDQWFISRVPLNIGASKELVQSAPSRAMKAVEGFEHYEAVEVSSGYADVEQRWVMFRNKQSQETEQKALTRRMRKKSTKEFQKLEKLSKRDSGAKLMPWKPLNNGRNNQSSVRQNLRLPLNPAIKAEVAPLKG